MYMRRLHPIKFFIKDNGFPACVNCKFFIPYVNPNPNVKSDIQLSTCKMFGIRDLVSGEVINTLAKECRTDTSLCDANGFFFDERDPPK